MNKYTPNYNLDLYDVDDKPNLNDQYNDAMGKIDTEIMKQAQDITTAQTAVNNLSTKVDTFEESIQKNTDDISSLETSLNGLETSTNASIADLTTKVETAQTTAENGVSAAHEANELAVQASSAAQSAQSTANQAQATANQAISSTALAKLKNSTFVCVGDSYGKNTFDSMTWWPTQIKNILGTGSTVYNGCVGGTGFLSQTNSFNSQLIQIASGLTQDQKSKVDYVIIGGGRNDDGSTSRDTLVNAAKTCVQTAISQFPNSTVVMVPMLWDAGPGSGPSDFKKASALNDGAVNVSTSKNVIIPVQYAWTWLKGLSDAMLTDAVHPNAVGARIIAQYMLAAISGSYSGRTYFGYVNTQGMQFTFVGTGGLMSVSAQGTAAESTTEITLPAGTVPLGCRPPFYINGVGFTNYGNRCAGMQFVSDGSIIIRKAAEATSINGPIGCQMAWPW